MTDLIIVNEKLAVIEFNFDEVKGNLIENLREYESLVVTEESLSICKQNQKSLAKLKNKIDTYRKDVKKRMSVPISEFEDKCKELFSLVEQAEEPLKLGIKVYDDETRQNKISMAQAKINALIETLELNNKYASKLTVLDGYSNLSSKDKATILDIEQRAAILKIEQSKELEMIEMVEDAIEKENKNISQKMKLEDFKNLIESNSKTVKELVNTVEEKAKYILNAENELKEKAKRELEKEIEEKRIKAEQEVLRLAEEEAIKAEKERLKLEEEQKELEKVYIEQEKEIEVPIIAEVVTEVFAEVIEEEKPIEIISEKKCQVELSVTGTISDMKDLKAFLECNFFDFKINSQTVIK